MAIYPPLLPSGWRNWTKIYNALVSDTTNNPQTVNISTTDVEQNVKLTQELFVRTFGEVSSTMLPSPKFSIYAPISNNFIKTPWGADTRTDFEVFLTAGGTTGSLFGALAGLGQVAFRNAFMKTAMSIGLANPDGQGPTFGYCINEIYAERVYVALTALRDELDGQTVVTDLTQDVLQKYRVSRFILHHGLVETFYKNNDPLILEEYLSLGVDKVPESALKKEFTLKIIRSIITEEQTINTETISVNCKGFLPNGDVIISPIPSNIRPIAPGDFYILDKPIFIDDPYFMGGIWKGTETEAKTTRVSSSNNQEVELINSGFDFPVTSSQIIYEKCKIVGGYGLLDKEKKTPMAGGVGQPFIDSDTAIWAWCLFDKEYTESDSYYSNKKDRPIVNYTVRLEPAEKDTTESGTSTPAGSQEPINVNTYAVKTTLKATCKKEDVLYGVNNKLSNHVRIEITEGGSEYRNNFYSPILQREFAIQDDKYFKILAQIDGCVLDIEYESIDKSAKFNVDKDFFIINQYAWKINEHYSGNAAIPYGFGKIKNVEILEEKINPGELAPNTEGAGQILTKEATTKFKTVVEVECDFRTMMSRGTYRAPTYVKFEEDYLTPNSFHKRFTEIYKENTKIDRVFEKGFGWILETKSAKREISYPIVKLKEVKYPDDDRQKEDGNISFFYELDGKYENLKTAVMTDKVTTTAHVFFGPPFRKEFGYPGGINITKARAAAGTLGLSGYFRSPIVLESLPATAIIGLLDYTYWGVNISGYAITTPLIFISTPEGVPSLCSVFNECPKFEGVLYTDYSTNKLTFRFGCLDFSEFPEKREIAIGHYAATKDAGLAGGASSTFVIKLDRDYDRISSINLKLKPTTSIEDGIVTFALGDANNYYGAEVSGDGKFSLQGTNELKYQIEANDIRKGDAYISPVYMYKPGFNSLNPQRVIHIGAPTSQLDLYIKGGIGQYIKDSKVESCKVNYIYESQTIDSFGSMDIFELRDGELVIFYNKIIKDELIIDDQLNNSPENKTEWKYSSGSIMCIGMHGGIWGTPIIKRTANTTGAYSIPIMIANTTEYLFSLYDKISNYIYIFAKCFTKEAIPYLGCFTIPINELFLGKITTNEQTGNQNSNNQGTETTTSSLAFAKPKTSSATKDSVLSNSYKNEDMPFWYRPLRIGAAINDDKKTYTHKDNIPKTNMSLQDLTGDNFVRVYGLKETDAQIKGDNFGILSGYFSKQGYLIVFIDTPSGLSFIFSTDGGLKWRKSVIILSKEGSNGFMFDDYKIYYLVPGIGVLEKDISIANISEIINVTIKQDIEGNQEEYIELLQKNLDTYAVRQTSTGVVNPQRFSGHVTNDGTRKIFFYNSVGYLSCTESKKDGYWNIANNF